MPSSKEPQHGRGGHRKGRCHSSPERVNTARPDEEHCNMALQLVNAVDELPASEVEVSITDSPTLQRLQREVYELSEMPAADQPQIALFQRPTSSGFLSAGERFTFGTRRRRGMDVRREKQPPIQKESLPRQSSKGSQSAKKAGEQPDVPALDEEHSLSLVDPSNCVIPNGKDVATTTRIDMTRTSPSAVIQTIPPTNTTEDTQSTQESIYQEPSGNVTCEPRSENLAKSGVDELAVCHTETLSVEAQPHSPFDIIPLGNRGHGRSQKHSPNVQNPLPVTNIPRPTVHPQPNFLPLAIEQAHLSKKEMQDCSAQADDLRITPTVPRDDDQYSLNALGERTVPQAELTNLVGTQDAGSKQAKNVDGPTQETLGSQPPHTPQGNALRPAKKPTKVCKVSSNPRPVLQPTVPGCQGVTEPSNVILASDALVAISRDAAPSEEDLFYLLMHRQRQRKDIQNRILVRQKQLETVNARLSQQNHNYQRQLSVARTSQDQSAGEAKVQKVALEDFKARFQKLKTFVNGLGSDYSALRHQADQMKLSQQSLLNEKGDIHRDLRNCHTASAASERSMSSIVANVAKVRESIAPLEHSLLDAEKKLESESHLLSKEQQKNKRLETYLLRVATTQNRYSSGIQNEQKAIRDQLRDITTKINVVEKAMTAEQQPLQLPGLDDCVRMLTTLHDADRVGLADLTKVTDAVSTLSQSLSSYRKSSDEGFQAAADTQINCSNQLIAQITTLLESLRATPVQEGQLAGLREDKTRLEEQLKSSESVMREIREGRKTADTREIHLRNTTDGLLNQLKALQNQRTAVHKPSSLVDERDMLGTWLVKYTNISQQLTNSEERVSEREKEIREGEEKVRKLTVQLKDAQVKRNVAVQALNEAEDRGSTQEGELGELQQKLADKENSLEGLRLEIKSADAKIREKAEKAEELAGLRAKHQTELDEVKSQLKSASQERAKANQQVQQLKDSLKGFAEAQQEAAKVSELTEELEKEHARVTKLHQEIAPLEEIARQVPGLKQQLSGKQKTIESLEVRLKETETASKQVEILERKASKAAEDTSTLRAELRNAQKDASRAAEQKEEFRKTTQEVEELRKKLVEFESLADQVPGLQKEAQDHSDEVTRLQKELALAKKSIEQLQDLQAANRRSGEEIILLKKEISAADEKLQHLQGVKDASDWKDHEARVLNERLRSAEDSLSHFQDLNEAISNKDKDIITLNQELETAKDSLEHLKSVQDANDLKDEEIVSLKRRLGAAESILNEVEVVKEESQRKDNELSILKNRLAKIEENSQQFSQTLIQWPSQDQDFSRGKMAVMTRDDSDFQTELAVTEPPVLDSAPQLRRKAARNVKFVNPQALQTRITETVRVESKGKGNPSSSQGFEAPKASHLVQITGSEILRTQETTFVPESQPTLSSRFEQPLISAQSFGSMSSPLTDVGPFNDSSCEAQDESAYFGPEKAADGPSATFTKVPVNLKSSPRLPLGSQRDLLSSRPPSSSTGDTMLLEAEEELKNLGHHHTNSFQESSRQRVGAQPESSSPEGPPKRKTEGILGNGMGKLSSKTAKAKSTADIGASSKHPSPRRLRSESQTRPKNTMPLQERSPSDHNIPVSPQGGMLREKHLPNSAVKRRLEEDEMSVPSPSQDGSKRQKRSLSALEVKTPNNKKRSSLLDQVTPVRGTGRLNHPSMPTGGRKGSIIGTSAPAPGADQHTSKKSMKTSKTERYSARFNQDTT